MDCTYIAFFYFNGQNSDLPLILPFPSGQIDGDRATMQETGIQCFAQGLCIVDRKRTEPPTLWLVVLLITIVCLIKLNSTDWFDLKLIKGYGFPAHRSSTFLVWLLTLALALGETFVVPERCLLLVLHCPHTGDYMASVGIVVFACTLLFKFKVHSWLAVC